MGIAKVGQNPSSFDIATADLRRFSGVLNDIDMGELKQAALLHSHGAAVGAFVYLRRIFERILDRHYDEYTASGGVIDRYYEMSVEDRVLALKPSLPEEVVENRKVYRILSKGINQLEEAECAALYDVMQAAIFEVIERDIYYQQKKKLSADLREAVAAAAGKLGPKKGTDNGGKKEA